MSDIDASSDESKKQKHSKQRPGRTRGGAIISSNPSPAASLASPKGDFSKVSQAVNQSRLGRGIFADPINIEISP